LVDTLQKCFTFSIVCDQNILHFVDSYRVVVKIVCFGQKLNVASKFCYLPSVWSFMKVCSAYHALHCSREELWFF